MEDTIIQMASNGGPIGVLAAAIVYLIIFLQRKSTSEKRNDDTAQLQSQIDELEKELATMKTEKQLLQKDINYLMSENIGIKEDIKEIKNTLNTMALALERIAAKYNNEN